MYLDDAAGRGNVRVLMFRELVRAAVLLAEEGRATDQPELSPGPAEEGQAGNSAADPFADYYRQEADPADPCLD